MDKLFNPKSIAIIGASRNKAKLGYQILENLVNYGFKGHIYPINPEANNILNLPVYKNISQVPEIIDLVIVIVPAKIVPSILRECAQKNVSFAIVISSGFAEIGENGVKLQAEIKEIVNSTNLRVLGPNCLGLINTFTSFNATFAAPEIQKGNVSAVFQSGALGVALFDWAKKYNFGFSKFISLGNKVDLEESEIIDYLQNDPETKVIAVYLEQIANPLKFLNVCEVTSFKKPIIILKGGTTNLGAKAAFSHTASIVGSMHTTKAIFAQSNLLVARTIEEMLNLIQILNSEPPFINNELAIVTNAGGPSILATDVAARTNIELPAIPEKDQNKLKKTITPIGSFKNPIDLTGEANAEQFNKAIKYCLDSPVFGAVLVLLTPQTSTEVEKTAQILASYAQSPKPVIASFLGDLAVEKGVDILRQANVPHFEDPELAVYAMSKLTKYWQKIKTPNFIINLEHHDYGANMLGDPLELVSRYNIPTPPSGMATNFDVATKIVERIGFPLAVKNISPDIVHKYKAGKIVLNVSNAINLKDAVKKVGFPVLIQQMVDLPFEIIVGAKRDKDLGTLITFGWGGVFVEDLQDISTCILPLTELDLDEMIKETKIGQVLIREKIDLSIIKNILIDISQIMIDFPEITEMDLNPIKIGPGVALCVDARYKVG